MLQSYCTLVLLFSISILLVTLGSIYIFKKDSAWKIVEFLLSTVKPQRTPGWERIATINGVIMLVSGVMYFIFIVYILLK